MDLHVDWGTALVTIVSLAVTHGTAALLYVLKKRDEYIGTVNGQKALLRIVTELKTNDETAEKKFEALTSHMGRIEGEVKQALGAAAMMKAVVERLETLEQKEKEREKQKQ